MKFLQRKRRAPHWSWFHTVVVWSGIWSLWLIYFTVFYRVRRQGVKNVPETGPLIYVSNHQSHFDPLLVGIVVHDRPFTSMARESLFRGPLGWAMWLQGGRPIKRGKSDRAALEMFIEELNKGGTVLVFPEGTRCDDGALAKFQRGVQLLLKRSDATVVPCAVEGAYDVWPRGQTLPRIFGKIMVRAGSPITHEELMKDGPAAALERLKREIETIRMSLREQLREATGGRLPAPGPGDVPYWEREDLIEEEPRPAPPSEGDSRTSS
jgi:1-acyl-sn-glycerol-3-phosphate acyltransferase